MRNRSDKYTLRKSASKSLPSYEADDGPLSDKTLDAIRKAEPYDKEAVVISSLFE